MNTICWNNYYHYSSKRIEKPYSVCPLNVSSCGKPSGLYFSSNNDWLHWCQENEYFPSHYKFKYQLKDIQNASIYILNQKNHDEFVSTYGSKDNIYPGVQWDKLEVSYDGILISNDIIRQFLSYENEWYFVWCSYDVETLVLWDPDNVSIQLVEERDFLADE